jgi:hypothetical protein
MALLVHVCYMSSEVEPCVVWALRVLIPFLAKLIEDWTNKDRGGPCTFRKSSLAREGSDLSGKNLPGQLERGAGDGEGCVIGRDNGTVVSDQGR